MPDELAHVCVIGAGTMGRGIAQVALAAGHEVTLVDPQVEQRQAAVADISTRLQRKDPDGAAAVIERLSTTVDIGATAPIPHTVVIEAVVEALDVKHRVFREALEHFGPSCILATNTSSLSITDVAAGVAEPSRVVGMHFFNPVPAMKLVEVVAGIHSDVAVLDTIDRLARSWGKQVARVRSAPGFIVNRVARGFYGEALRLVEERVAPPEVIDDLVRSAGGFRMGPFELMDLIGVEVNLAVTRTVWEAFNFDPRFAPSLIQSELVAAGRLGRKSGHGFYLYGEGNDRVLPDSVSGGPSAPPEKLVLHGTETQLATLLTRADLPYDSVPAQEPAWLELVGVGAVVVTHGRTAVEEARRRAFAVGVLDRCLGPEQITGLAFAAGDDAVADAVVALLGRAGIRAHRVEDAPGLVLGRMLSVIGNEAWEAAHHGVASPDDIDAAMRLGTNYPMGPFAWTREWGTSAVLEILDTMWSEYHDPRYRASQRLRAAARAEASVAG